MNAETYRKSVINYPNTEQLAKLKEKLKEIKGYRDILAAQSQYSTGYIDQILNGDRRNALVIKLAFELLKEKEAERIEQAKLLK